AGQPVATRQTTAMARPDSHGRWTFTRPGTWQGGRNGLARPIMYGARNSRIANSVRELLAEGGIVDIDETVTSLDDARALAPGRRGLTPDSTRPGRSRRSPTRCSASPTRWALSRSIGTSPSSRA